VAGGAAGRDEAGRPEVQDRPAEEQRAMHVHDRRRGEATGDHRRPRNFEPWRLPVRFDELPDAIQTSIPSL
jgi:hypothetical protein